MSQSQDQARLIVGTATGVCQIVSAADGAAELVDSMTPLPHAVARLAVCQTQPHIVYLAAYEGGMWRSDDGGGAWRQLHSFPVEHAHSVAVDPHDAAVVYVGSEPATIFHSRDGGATWQECQGFRAVPESKRWHFFAPRHAHVRDLVMATDDAQRLYAGLEVGGVVRSTDGGATWQQLHGPYEDVHSLSVTPARSQVLYAATARHPWRSDDGGETWTAIGDGLPQRYTVPIAAALDDPDIVLVSCSTSFQRQTGFLARSTDGGWSWQKVTWPGQDDDMVIAIAWDPAEPRRAFAGTDGGKLYRSIDHGASWQALPVALDSVAVGGLLVMPG
jgi:photosystem II stability/assembly factor-like uncharacterized protein